MCCISRFLVKKKKNEQRQRVLANWGCSSVFPRGGLPSCILLHKITGSLEYPSHHFSQGSYHRDWISKEVRGNTDGEGGCDNRLSEATVTSRIWPWSCSPTGISDTARVSDCMTHGVELWNQSFSPGPQLNGRPDRCGNDSVLWQRFHNVSIWGVSPALNRCVKMCPELEWFTRRSRHRITASWGLMSGENVLEETRSWSSRGLFSGVLAKPQKCWAESLPSSPCYHMNSQQNHVWEASGNDLQNVCQSNHCNPCRYLTVCFSDASWAKATPWHTFWTPVTLEVIFCSQRLNNNRLI